MNWITALCRTYEANSHLVGDQSDRVPLAPVGHTVQNTHITITIDQNGHLAGAHVSPQLSIIPCTESSAGRTSAPVAHPLTDKLQYVADDYYELTGAKKSKPPKEGSRKTPHELYIEALSNWANSDQGDVKLTAILDYLKKCEGNVISDLCTHGIFQLEGGKIPKTWKGNKDTKPEIYEVTKNSPAPWDAFVRWEVNIPGDPEPRTLHDHRLWRKWEEFVKDSPSPLGLCYVEGKVERLALSHPKKIRSVADGAKLVSANDSSGFTFRGRFTDNDGSQACGISFDATQKAHNALRWLIARQGKRYGDQAIVAWAVTGQKIPSAFGSTHDLFDEEEFLNSGLDLSNDVSTPANTAQGVGLALKKKLAGYRAELGDTTNVIVLSLDSATPGRMAISYYRELTSSEFLARLEKWHEETAWPQNFGKERKFIGAPSPLDIGLIALGKPREDKNGKRKLELDDGLKAATYRRILPCIIEDRPIPPDLVSSCIHRATNRQGLEHWEWEKALGIACALYRKQQTNQYHHTMSLERDRTTRSYLYGRLLAVADVLEQAALRSAGEKRDTNASRFMQRFAVHPNETWTNIYLSLEPYRRRLKANAPGLLNLYESEFDEIKNLFESGDFNDDSKLAGEFLLAYHCQRTALYTSKDDKPAEEQPA